MSGISWDERQAKEKLKQLSYQHLLKRMQNGMTKPKEKDFISLEFVKVDARRGINIFQNFGQIAANLGELDIGELRELSTSLRSRALQTKPVGISEVWKSDNQDQIRGDEIVNSESGSDASIEQGSKVSG